MSAFNTLILDVDSTLCGVEGIDWLAKQKGSDVTGRVARLTRQAMDGDVDLDTVYGTRLALVAPTRDDLTDLGAEYVRGISPGALDAIRAMQAAGVSVHLVSGGLLAAVDKVAEEIQIAPENVHAVGIYFEDDGTYAGFESDSPLTKQRGKCELIASLALQGPVLLVGDGMTDAEAKPAVDSFAAFTAYVRRAPVVALADHVVSTFGEILELVSG
ncbi:MAG: HAD-IB family phosphatase [Gemmatimonadota bacterium]|nr:HAD-IB family phosphatase [Gemmatimonadota bacterium]